MGALTLAGERRAPPPTVAAPQAQLPLEQERERRVAWRTPHPPSSPRRPHEPSRRGRDELRPASAPLPGAPNIVVLQTTAGWRKAPALAQRVCTRGLASPSSISLKNTMNTARFRVVRAAGAQYPTSTMCCIAFPRESSSVLVCCVHFFFA